MDNEEVHFPAHKIGALKIEGQTYKFFSEWDSKKGAPKYWATRDDMQNPEPMEKTSGRDAVWYKNGTRLNLNASAMLNAMEREYRVSKDRLSTPSGNNGDSAVYEETETIAAPKDASQQPQDQEKPNAPQPPTTAKTNAPAKTYERAEIGTLTMDGDNYHIFRTWRQSNVFGSYAYERCMEGSENSEAIYKSTATGRALWSNFSGRELGIAISCSLNSLDDRAGYEDLENYRNYLDAFRKAEEQKKTQEQKKPKPKPAKKPAPSSRIDILKAAQKKAARKHGQRASRAPLHHREIGKTYNGGDCADTDDDRNDLGVFEDEGPALTYSDIKRKGLLDL